VANVPKIRNAANTAWVDVFCKGGWKIKKADGTWILATPGNAKIRNADNTGWLDIVCPLPYGTLISTYCDGTTKMGTYANGTGGTYNSIIQSNSTECGYVPPPAAGTLLDTYCQGTTKMGTYANGTGGSYNQAIEYNSLDCGYTAPPAAGTLLSTYCSGTTKMGRYANGTGGSYNQAIEVNSVDCGYVPIVEGPTGIGWKFNWGGPGTLGWMAKGFFKEFLSEPVPNNGTAIIQDGPNKGKSSPRRWIGTDFGWDNTIHPKTNAIYPTNAAMTTWAGFGEGKHAVYRDTKTGIHYILLSNEGSALYEVVASGHVSAYNRTYYTAYYDPYGFGPGHKYF
jgi:hypothetical protein